MEPSEAPVRFIIRTHVRAIEQRFECKYLSGVGDKAVFTDVSLGWFVWFDGSYETLHVGMEKPKLKVGDKIRIIIEEERTP